MSAVIRVIFLSMLIFVYPANAAERVALVIGNSAYQSAPLLNNPGNDANDMAAKLESLGFKVVKGIDLDLRSMQRAVLDFKAELQTAELALFFYAGHGIQVNGQNYVLPVDAAINDEASLDFEALTIDSILKVMASVPTNVVFLDACRDNPFLGRLSRSLRPGRSRNVRLEQGLAQFDAGTGTLVAFATHPGSVAFDGEGRNSPFTTALLEHIGSPGGSLTDELIAVRRHVLAATNETQRPWDSSSLTGRVILNPAIPFEAARESSGSEAAPSQREEPVARPAEPDLIGRDFDFARSVGTAKAWETFIERHGSSDDIRLVTARKELRALSPETTAQASLQSPPDSQRSTEPADRTDTELVGKHFEFARSIGTISAWEAFLAQHGDSGDIRVATARSELKRLNAEAAENQKPAPQPEATAGDPAANQCQSVVGLSLPELAELEVDAILAACDTALRQAPLDANLHFAQGRILHGKERFKEAIAAYRQAMDLGEAAATTNLGVLYEEGKGVEKDLVEAIRLYRLAGEQGEPYAIYNLAGRYDEGAGGLPLDFEESARLLLKAHRLDKSVLQAQIDDQMSLWNSGTISALQRLLKAEGLYTGAIDGKFGRQMRAALEAVEPATAEDRRGDAGTSNEPVRLASLQQGIAAELRSPEAADISRWKLDRSLRLSGYLGKASASPDRSLVAVVAQREGQIHVLETAGLKLKTRIAIADFEQYQVEGIAVLPGSERVALVNNGVLQIYEIATGKVVQSLARLEPYRSGDLTVSADGRTLYFNRVSIEPQQSHVTAFSLDGDRISSQYEMTFPYRIDSFDVSPDGSHFLFGTYPDDTLVYYDVAEGREVWSRKCSCSGRFGLQGQVVVFAGREGKDADNWDASPVIGITDATTGSSDSIHRISGTTSLDVHDVSPDGRFAAIGSTENGRVTIVSAEVSGRSFKPLVVLNDRSGQNVAGAAFTADARLVTLSEDNNARLWSN